MCDALPKSDWPCVPVRIVKRRGRLAPLPLSLSLLVLACQTVCAQPADDYFHSGAQSYLTNNLAKARQEVDAGLKLYPEDVKLKKLDELLKQQQQQQQSQDDQQKQDQKQDEQKQQQQSKQDQKEDQKQQQQDSSKDKQDQQQQDQQQAKSDGKQDDKKQGEPAEPMQAHAMTPQEAQKLLDAQKGEEQVFQFRPAERPERRARPIKDW